MKRCIPVLALALAAVIGAAHADYIRISYNLGVSKKTSEPQAVAPAGPGRIPGGRGIPVRPGPGGIGRGVNPTAPSSPILEEEDDGNLKAEAVIEYTKYDNEVLRGPDRRPKGFLRIYHKWGKTGLIETADMRVFVLAENNAPLPAVKARYKFKRNELLKDAKGPDRADKLVQLAKWTLGHGLLKETVEAFEELGKAAPDDPAFKAFKAAEAELAKPLSDGPYLKRWKEKMEHFANRDSAHYCLIYDPAGVDSAVANDYMDLLEANMKGFYYWFATRGNVRPAPEHRLVVILIHKPDLFQQERRVFGSPLLVADGFYARRENVAIFSSVRLDDVYQALEKSTRDLWQGGWSREKLLQGLGRAGKEPEEIVKNQMLALLLKALQEESMRATVSHEGNLQLATATGILPRNVEIPDWVQFGIGSYFETPKGAYWPGMGVASWRYLARYKAMEEAKAANKKLDRPEEAIRNVVTDRYFREARDKPNDAAALMKARTMAWALMYFLAEQKSDNLVAYFQELSNLPRDLHFDEATLLGAFGRAFDMVDSSNLNQVNQTKLSKLANEWYQFIHYTNLESSDAYHEGLEQALEKVKKKRGGSYDRSSAQPAKRN